MINTYDKVQQILLAHKESIVDSNGIHDIGEIAEVLFNELGYAKLYPSLFYLWSVAFNYGVVTKTLIGTGEKYEEQ